MGACELCKADDKGRGKAKLVECRFSRGSKGGGDVQANLQYRHSLGVDGRFEESFVMTIMLCFYCLSLHLCVRCR